MLKVPLVDFVSISFSMRCCFGKVAVVPIVVPCFDVLCLDDIVSPIGGVEYYMWGQRTYYCGLPKRWRTE